MKLSRQEFKEWRNKSVTLLGMSGVGKTTLSALLPTDKWFHYSGDYRIGTRYLNEHILDQVKKMAMQQPFLAQQLRKDSIYIRNNITIDNLSPMSDFTGKIGNPELGGLKVKEFKRRQALFRSAEVAAMRDVAEFIERARSVYHYPHFLNDAGGSICGLGDTECWQSLDQHSLILYLRADSEMEETLIRRAQKHPKPMHYEEAFLDQHLNEYLAINQLSSSDQINPDEFVQWIFPCLLEYRKPQYERVANRYGFTADASKIQQLRDEQDFVDFVCGAIDAREPLHKS